MVEYFDISLQHTTFNLCEIILANTHNMVLNINSTHEKAGMIHRYYYSKCYLVRRQQVRRQVWSQVTSRQPNSFLHQMTEEVGGKSDGCRYCLSAGDNFLNASLYSLSNASINNKKITRIKIDQRHNIAELQLKPKLWSVLLNCLKNQINLFLAKQSVLKKDQPEKNSELT